MKRLLLSLQRRFGISKNEGIVILVLTAGMIGGTASRYFTSDAPTHQVVSAEKIIELLDSIAKREAHSDQDFLADSIDSTPQSERSADGNTANWYHQTHSADNNRLTTRGKIVRVNINSASKTQLEQIPGIGPATAQKIIEMRRNRKFRDVADLLDVKGIGPKKLEKMRPYINAP